MGKQIFFLLQDLVRMRRSPVAGFLRRHRGQLPGNIFFPFFSHYFWGKLFRFILFFIRCFICANSAAVATPSSALWGRSSTRDTSFATGNNIFFYFFVPFVGDLNEFCFFFRWDKVDCIQAPRFYSVNEHLYD